MDMFGKTRCKECGMTLEADEAIKNSGRLFCSEECSTEYNTKKSKDRQGCCC